MTSTTTVGTKSLWAGRILSTLAVLFFLMDSIMKLWKPVFVVQATEKLGFPESTIVGIGLALLIPTLLYILPRTSVLGAVLITGYLGGAVATQVRLEDWANVPFPIVFAAIAWLGLWLRDARLRQRLPLSVQA